MSYNKDIAIAIKSFLDSDDWKYSFDEESGVFKFGLSLTSKLKHASYVIRTRSDSFSVRATIELGAKDCLAEMGEYLHRANYGMAHGNFELDWRDGEIGYKCFVPCGSRTPASDVIKEAIYVPAVMLDKYGNGIAAIMFGMMTPKEAIEAAEKD